MALRVLFVEDSEPDTEIVVHHLQKGGFDPQWERVETEQDFSAAIKRGPWDLVLADYTMPHFSGTAALKLLKEANAEIPLIILSGTIGEETAVAALKSGAADYLVKGNLARLVPAVQRELRESEFRRERLRAQGWSAFLTEAGRVLAGTLEYETTLRNIVRLAEKRISDWCAIYRLDQKGKLEHLWVPRDDPEKDALTQALHDYAPTSEEEFHPVVQTLRSGQPMLIPEIAQELLAQVARDARHLELMKRADVRTVMHIPLAARGQTFGVVTFAGGPLLAPYTEGDLRRGNEFAAHAALAIDNARLFAEAERARIEAEEARRRVQLECERLITLREVNRAIGGSLDPHAVLNIFLQETARILPYPTAACICLINPATGALEPAAVRGLDERDLRARPDTSYCQCEFTLRSRGRAYVGNVQTDPHTQHGDLYARKGLISYLGLPMEVQGTPLGVLSLYTFREHVFTQAETDLLSGLAEEVAMVIRSSKLFEKVSRQADELEKANRVQTEFLGFMSHELRTPLTALIGYTKMLREGLLGSVTTNQQTALAKIMRYAGDLHAMISSILEATRIETGEARPEPREVSLLHLMEDLRSAYTVPMGKAIDLSWHYPDELPAVRTDGIKLRHIFQNLIDNAIKYTDSGHIAVVLQHFAESGQFQITVADTGIGISAGDHPHIFEMFRQAERQHEGSRGGVGMGLYIVKKFVGLLGGTVEVVSEPGKGSTFTVTLPIEPPAQN